MKRLPDFIIIGAMKCATSTLHDQLAQQPGVFMTEPKEPCFFSDDEQYARGRDWYESLFAGAAERDLCGESSTHYTKLPTYPQTIERMQRVLPRLKLIYVMRHPIDRLVSHFVHDWSERKVDVSIDEAVDRRPELIDYGRYAMQLEPFFEAYGPQAVLPVFFERLVSKPQEELERVCRFIGYDGEAHWQTEQGASNVSSARLRDNGLRDAIVWNPVVTFVRRRCVPQAWRDRVKRFWQIKRRPQLGEEQIARLKAVFDEDLAKLGSWLDVAITCDNFKDVALKPAPTWAGLALTKSA